MAAKGVLTPKRDWGEVFLAQFRDTGNVRASCEAAGVTRQAAYHRRDTDAAFAAAWADAAEDACERLEMIAQRRAESQSDVLMIFLLKGLKPEKYRENVRQEISGPEGGPVRISEIRIHEPDRGE